MQLITGSSNIPLAEKIALDLNMPLLPVETKKFADGELSIKLFGNVVDEEVYIIQSLAPFVNEYLIEFLLLANAARREGAKKITAIIPYYAYARQDKEALPNFLGTLLAAAGIEHLLAIDFHNVDVIESLPFSVENLTTTSIFSKDIQSRFKTDSLVVLSPDEGGAFRANSLAKLLGIECVVLKKIRRQIGDICILNIKGNLKGKTCLIVDDIIDSGLTIFKAAEALKEGGVKEIHAYITHAVLSEGAIERVGLSNLDSLTATNSINLQVTCDKFRLLSIGELVSENIKKEI